MNVVFVLTNGDMYGDNKALYNLMPFLISRDITPFFIIPKESEAFDVFHCFTDRVIGYDNKRYYSLYYQKTVLSKNIFKRFLRPVAYLVRRKLCDKKEYQLILKAVLTFCPQLVHTNNSGCILGFQLACDLGIKHLWHIREYGDRDANWQYLPSKKCVINRFRKKNNYNIAITASIKQHFLLPTHNTEVIYDGALSQNKYALSPSKDLYYLYVGRLFPNKGLELLLKAFSLALSKNREMKLMIAGRGDDNYYYSLLNQAKLLGISDCVEFLGYRKDIPQLMSRAKAVIIPSKSEAFGFVTAEAMYYGADIMGYNTAGTKEQMDNVDKFLKESFCMRFESSEQLATLLLQHWERKYDVEKHTTISEYVKRIYSAEESANNFCNYIIKILNL